MDIGNLIREGMALFNKTRIVLREHEVPVRSLPRGLDGVRIVHFGDMHAPKGLDFCRQLNHVIRSARPDLVAFTGDLLDLPHWASTARRELPAVFEGLQPALGIYGVLGNHDGTMTAGLLESVGVRMVLNQCVSVRHGRATLHVAGVNTRWSRRVPQAAKNLAPLLPPVGPTIVLAHWPSTIHYLPREKVDLQLSGHTHAGQWRFPRVGCLWPHDDIPRQRAWGLHRMDGTHLHVTAGLGESGPVPVRFCCPPEVAVLTLRPACDSPGHCP